MVRTGLADQAVGMAGTVTVNDVLDGHVGLDVECLDSVKPSSAAAARNLARSSANGPGGI